jgi:hypothetical protein
MRKHDKKLTLSRETLLQLDPHKLERQLARARGGVVWTGCMSDCTECGTQPGPYYPDQNGTM